MLYVKQSNGCNMISFNSAVISNIQSTLSALTSYTEGRGIINSTVLNSGSSFTWYKYGKICHVDFVINTRTSSLQDYALLCKGLPEAKSNQRIDYHSADINRLSKNGVLEITVTGELHECWYYKPTAGIECKGGFMYITK